MTLRRWLLGALIACAVYAALGVYADGKRLDALENRAALLDERVTLLAERVTRLESALVDLHADFCYAYAHCTPRDGSPLERFPELRERSRELLRLTSPAAPE